MANKSLDILDPPYWWCGIAQKWALFLCRESSSKKICSPWELNFSFSFCLGCSLSDNCMVKILLHFFRSLFRYYQLREAFPNLNRSHPPPSLPHNFIFLHIWHYQKQYNIFSCLFVGLMSALHPGPHHYYSSVRVKLMFTTVTLLLRLPSS